MFIHKARFITEERSKMPQLMKLSTKEQIDYLHFVVDDYSGLAQDTVYKYLLESFKPAENLQLAFETNPFFLKHKKVLHLYIDKITAKKKTIKLYELLQDIIDNNIEIFFSYNFDQNDFSKIENFSDKIEQLSRHQIINSQIVDITHYSDNTFNFISRNMQYPYINLYGLDLDTYFKSLNPHYYSFYIKNYLKHDLSQYFNNSINSLAFTAMFSWPTNYKRHNELESKSITIFMNSFYNYLTNLDSETLNANLFKILNFIKTYDKEYYSKRKEFHKFLIHYVQTNSIDNITILLSKLQRTYTNFKNLKIIINDNCKSYNLSSLYTSSKKNAYFYDFEFEEKNINIIFNEIDILQFQCQNFFFEKINKTQLRLRIISENEIKLSPNQVIEEIQKYLKTIKLPHKSKSYPVITSSILSLTRLLSLNSTISETGIEKIAHSKKKL